MANVKCKDTTPMFWNIDKNSSVDKTTFAEHTLKYGDFDDIKMLFKQYDKSSIKKIWLETMAFDKRFIKINLMIARVFFDMDVASDYFKSKENERFKVRVSVK